MNTEGFLARLKEQGAELAPGEGHATVARFGNVSEEIAAIGQRPLITPLTHLGRITARGKDRAKFIHNFCTNNILPMSSGDCVEAFFTDVKARILAHGLVHADDAQHDIWLPGNEAAALHTHLDRYIITEDVALSVPDASIGLALLTPGADAVSLPFDSATTHWDGVSVTVLTLPADQAIAFWQQETDSGRSPIGALAFDHLRIRARYPVIGTDLSSDHLAPEADRNQQAISYTKGCYLGQEPIARLDAMGHINRALRSLRISAPPEEIKVGAVISDGKAEVGQVTSTAPAESPDESLALSVIRLKDLDGEAMQVTTASGVAAAHLLT